MNEALVTFFDTDLAPTASTETIGRLRRAIVDGEHWYDALLDAVREWRLPEERLDGRVYRYLIAKEAFDWLVLAERLGESIADLVPADELEQLLFHGRAPFDLTAEEFSRRIGPAKYRAYLNYLYGVLVEEALTLAVDEEIHKERRCRVYPEDPRLFEDTHQRIYGATEPQLFKRFRDERGLPAGNTVSYHETREFTYWLFKYRLRLCHRARIASDTRKGLEALRRHWETKGQPVEVPAPPIPDDVIDVTAAL